MTSAGDPFDLDRYVRAQEPVFDQVLAELRAGRKRSHWMWFVFPQIAGLGHSAMARRYAIGSLAEARAYLDHPVLGPRLRECAGLVALTQGRTAEQIFGGIDARKLQSSMTLFARAAAAAQVEAADDVFADDVFADVVARLFAGDFDPATDARL